MSPVIRETARRPRGCSGSRTRKLVFLLFPFFSLLFVADEKGHNCNKRQDDTPRVSHFIYADELRTPRSNSKKRKRTPSSWHQISFTTHHITSHYIADRHITQRPNNEDLFKLHHIRCYIHCSKLISVYIRRPVKEFSFSFSSMRSKNN